MKFRYSTVFYVLSILLLIPAVISLYYFLSTTIRITDVEEIDNTTTITEIFSVANKGISWFVFFFVSSLISVVVAIILSRYEDEPSSEGEFISKRGSPIAEFYLDQHKSNKSRNEAYSNCIKIFQPIVKNVDQKCSEEIEEFNWDYNSNKGRESKPLIEENIEEDDDE